MGRPRLADVELPNDERFEYHSLRTPTAAVTVVLDPAAEHVLLSWLHRFVPDVWNYEVPGGIVEAGEDPAETIRRKILRETGDQVAAVRVASRNGLAPSSCPRRDLPALRSDEPSTVRSASLSRS